MPSNQHNKKLYCSYYQARFRCLFTFTDVGSLGWLVMGYKLYIIFTLLLIYTSRVRPWQDPSASRDVRADDSTDCPEQAGKEKDKGCTVPVPRDEDCSRKSLVSEKCGSDEVGSCTLCDLKDKNCDESELRMLDQEENDNTDEHCKRSAQVSTDGCQDGFVQTEMKADCDQTSTTPDETLDTGTCSKQEPHQPDCTEKKDVKEEGCVREEEKTEAPGDEKAEQSQDIEEVDPEMENENVPLREILLKLKPEGLTDDEDDQPSEYSATEASIGDVEVEEEALVSSGSAEKQDQDPNVNGTKQNGDASNSNSGSSNKKAVCLEVNATESLTDVEIINATTLMRLLQVDPNVTGRTTACPCHLVYFFSPYCPFSVVGSPYVNALARSLPNIPVYGLDSIEHHSVNARYGVMGTPTLLLFHNGNGVGRYNASEYSVSQLMAFVRHYTDQEIININVTSMDFRAKLPSQMAEARPYALWAAWVFLLSCASWLFLTSELCARLTEAVLNNWREAEAQNDHQD